MSFAVSLLSGIGSAVQQYYSLERQRRIAVEQREQALKVSQAEQDRIRRQTALAEGESLAAAGAAGRSTTGSALDVMVYNAQQYAMDIAMARYRGEAQAWAYSEQEKSIKYAKFMTKLLGPFGSGSALQGVQLPQWGQGTSGQMNAQVQYPGTVTTAGYGTVGSPGGEYALPAQRDLWFGAETYGQTSETFGQPGSFAGA